MNKPKTSRMDIVGQNGNDGLHYETEEKENDKINPSYYTKGISTDEYIDSHNMSYRAGCCIKYITRHLEKNNDPVEDLMKCRWYLDQLIKKYSSKDK